jgi:Zn-dependent protease
VAHGWMARYFGDRTAEMLGRLSLNPLRHIDPIGTVLVPGLLLAVGGPLFGWAKPVPVATSVLRNPRRAMVVVALAGPAANLVMAVVWCVVLGAILRVKGNVTLDSWIALMAQAGILGNVFLAVFNLLPIPPLDGGRVLAGLLPPRLGARLEKIEPVGLFIVLGLSAFGLFGWLFNPALRIVGRIINALFGAPA